ncbi:MAG: hypothetical protein SFW08_06925 [Gemmatimonadaceae bacterium]|nr:hypothetical protein [Gemmatimonadaceae bacterium]
MRHALLAVCALLSCTPRPTPSLHVTGDQFRMLRWLEGRWTGTGEDGAMFGEAYAVLDDSTMRSYTYTKPTDIAPSDSGAIRLRRGVVTSGDGEWRWTLTAVSADSAMFAPQGRAENGFTWRRTSDSTWTATLWRGSPNDSRPRRYSLVRAAKVP